ncbi:MAG: carbohydrate ABC transporter permease [Treponema sp.]|nr:carbohydrate ABC transporter permease [Treponema sp.]
MGTMRLGKSDFILLFFINTAVILLLIVIVYPLIYVISCSISSPDLVSAGKIWLLPRGLNILGYKRVFQDPAILTGYRNTILYTFFGTMINLIVTVPAGYSLSKSFIPGRNIIMGIFLFTMYFSGGLIPTFILVSSLGLFNNPLVLVILGAFSVYNSIICRTFFSAVPKEMEEAAMIDGASPSRTFFQIVLPVSQALLGVMVLYFAVGHWNSYFNAMIYIVKDSIKPLQLILRRILILETTSAAMMEAGADEYMGELYQVRELIKYAVIVVSSLPVLIMYPFLQKYFNKGVMLGSVKG